MLENLIKIIPGLKMYDFNEKMPPIDYLINQPYQEIGDDRKIPHKIIHLPFLISLFFIIFIGTFILFVYNLDARFYQSLGIDYAIFSFNLFPLFLESSEILFNLLKLFLAMSLLIILSASLFYKDAVQTWISVKKKLALTLVYSFSLLFIAMAVAILLFPILPHFYNVALALVLYFLSITYIFFTLFTKNFNFSRSPRRRRLTRFSIALFLIFLSLLILPDTTIYLGQARGELMANQLKSVIQKCDELSISDCEQEIQEYKSRFSRYPISIIDTADKDNRIYVLQCTPNQCAGVFVAASYNKKTLNSLVFSPQRYSTAQDF